MSKAFSETQQKKKKRRSSNFQNSCLTQKSIRMSQNSPSWWFRKISQHGATTTTDGGGFGASNTTSKQPRHHHHHKQHYDDNRSESHREEDKRGEHIIDRENPLGASSTEYVSKEDLGRATWLLLHSIASQYPDEPTEREKRDAKNLINAMATLYPCRECQTHFKTVIEKQPPEVESSVSFQEWMCKVHNAVNEKLGKELFDCAKIDERWGGVECFGEDGNDGGCSFENAPGKRKRLAGRR